MNQARVRTSRRGVMGVVALVCVAVATMLMMVMMRRAVGEWKIVRQGARHVQCRWLAESALDRAAARLSADPKYAGEVWKIPASSLGGNGNAGKQDQGQGGGAAVKIEVVIPSGRPSQRLVRVQADWPEDLPDRVRVSRQATMELLPAAKKK